MHHAHLFCPLPLPPAPPLNLASPSPTGFKHAGQKRDTYLARVACRIVLDAEANQPKALFRLAQAHTSAPILASSPVDGGEARWLHPQAYEIEGDIHAALRTLAMLIKLDGQRGNAEARRLPQLPPCRREASHVSLRHACFLDATEAKVTPGETG